jgi:hypothetical protein
MKPARWSPFPADRKRRTGSLAAGHVTTFGDYSKVIAYVCEECGLGVDVGEQRASETTPTPARDGLTSAECVSVDGLAGGSLSDPAQ